MKKKSEPIEILVLMSCHNRPGTTLKSIKSLVNSAESADLSLRVFLTETSDTRLRLRLSPKESKHVTVLEGDNSVFWAGAMSRSWQAAKTEDFSFLLWLNDDVLLFPEALRDLTEISESFDNQVIIAGSTVDPDSGRQSYGGYKLGPWYNRLQLSRIAPISSPQKADLSNGNVLLVPRDVTRTLGGFPGGLTHNMADLIFTHEAAKRGFRVMVFPGYVGECPANGEIEPWNQANLSLATRFALIQGPKGLPARDWLRTCRSIGGIIWPVVFFIPALKMFAKHHLGLLKKLRAPEKLPNSQSRFGVEPAGKAEENPVA